ncbi:MAG: sulfatase-like hydrolase/transferase, partial [Chitinivibrionales bacterium]|nr:sulfatase-like hydrolase/transferase [Chitinivibrionales bacterium]
PVTDSISRNYLPGFLRQFGYATTYIQGAPLSYMLKDAFMQRAGFDTSFGDTWFRRVHSESYWGVDDRTLFENMSDYIIKKNRQKKPWFITALTVGTHHPLNVPGIDSCTDDIRRLKIAYNYLDTTLHSFFQRLEKNHILDSTLVVITCDESRGVDDSRADQWTKRIFQQWGLLIVLHPNHIRKQITEPFSQMDIALSLADFCGTKAATPFWGRSIFRTYETPRDLFFSNTYVHLVGKMTDDTIMELTNEDFRSGISLTHPKNALFSPIIATKKILQEEQLAILAENTRAYNSSLTIYSSDNHRYLRLANKSTYPIIRGKQNTLLSGQNITIPGKSAVTVRLRGHMIAGDSSSKLYIKHDLASYSGTTRITRYMPEFIMDRDTFCTEYDFYTYRTYRSVELRFTAEIVSGPSAMVIIDSAVLVIDSRNPTYAEQQKWQKIANTGEGRDVGSFSISRPDSPAVARQGQNTLTTTTIQ